MIHLEWPELLLALPLPLLVYWLLPAYKPAEQAALKVPFIEDFILGKTRAAPKHTRARLVFASLAWLLLVVASTRPQWLGEPIEQAISGRDLILAVDLSGSMKERDFVINKKTVDRLTATKHIASAFIKQRVGDRLGLILFGSQAYLQTPLTFDRTTVITLLNEATIGLAGDRTAIGNAIGLAVKRLRQQQSQRQVLILLTDGANTAGEVTPLKAAELAAANGLKIYTIGIGADEMTVRDFFGTRKVNPSRDLDEKTLTAIATQTGGRYFRAKNTQELETIYQLLDSLEPIVTDKRYFRPLAELYYLPLGIALLLAGVISSSRIQWRRAKS